MALRLSPLLILSSLLAAGIIITPAPMASATTYLPTITVSGTHFHAGGADLTENFLGVDDTTGLVNAVYWWALGNPAVAGHNANFPVPVNPDDPVLDCESIGDYWSAYFACCKSIGVNLVRMGAFDSWGTEIMATAYTETLYRTEFFEVLDDMLHRANDYGVYVELVLAGSGEWPVYDWDCVPGDDNPFIVFSDAYNRYVSYVRAVMSHINAYAYRSALFAYDLWNEPDGNNINAGYWLDNQTMFHVWACAVANSTVGHTTSIVDMGTGGGTLFGWGEDAFMRMTGTTGFDVCHMHMYGSAEDDYLVTDRLDWADDAGKPLVIGELGYNIPYPIERWEWAEGVYFANGGQACIELSMRGTTDGYPIDIQVTASSSYSIWEGDGWSMTPTTNLTYNEWYLTTDSGAGIDFYSGELTWTPGYSDAGSYYLHIHCINPAGSGWFNCTMTVNDNPFIDPPTEWTVTITANDTSIYVNDSVSFLVYVDTGSNWTYQWNFGDGYYSTSVSPSHMFRVAGIYSVRCLANGTDSNHIIISVSAHALPPIPPDDGNGSGNGTIDAGALQIIEFMLPLAVIFCILFAAIRPRP